MTANRLPVGSGLILLATPCFVFPLRSEKRPPPFAPWADGTDLAGAALVGAASYQPRDAEGTVLHRVVRENLETFLREASDHGDGDGLPRFIPTSLPGITSSAARFSASRCVPSSVSIGGRRAAEARAMGGATP